MDMDYDQMKKLMDDAEALVKDAIKRASKKAEQQTLETNTNNAEREERFKKQLIDLGMACGLTKEQANDAYNESVKVADLVTSREKKHIEINEKWVGFLKRNDISEHLTEETEKIDTLIRGFNLDQGQIFMLRASISNFSLLKTLYYLEAYENEQKKK